MLRSRVPSSAVAALLVMGSGLAFGIPAAAADPAAWLQEYLQIDTTNPPGPGEEAWEFLESLLAREPAIERQRYVGPEGWTTLWARLPANGPPGGEALVLMHHVDVVPAEGKWSQPPFSGRREDGRIWGRGALDVKSLGIAQIAAMLELARDKRPRSRDVVLLATPDEETGGEHGVGWLLAERPELFRDVVSVLNEGGSNRVVGGRLAFWGVEVTQKRPLWMRVTSHGRGGHASGLRTASATHQLIRGLARVLERPPVWKVEEATRRYLMALARLEGRMDGLAFELDEVIRPTGPTRTLAPGLGTYFLDTLQVTRMENGEGTNVISPIARAWIDARLLPSTDAEAFRAAVEEDLGPSLELEVLLETPPAEPSSTESRLYGILERILGVRGPVVPTLMAGATDSRWFRQRGISAYGFQPFAIDAGELSGIHGRNESIPEDDLRRGIEMLRRILVAWVAEDMGPEVTPPVRR